MGKKRDTKKDALSHRADNMPVTRRSQKKFISPPPHYPLEDLPDDDLAYLLMSVSQKAKLEGLHMLSEAIRYKRLEKTSLIKKPPNPPHTNLSGVTSQRFCAINSLKM